jgi:hypothetical protein
MPSSQTGTINPINPPPAAIMIPRLSTDNFQNGSMRQLPAHHFIFPTSPFCTQRASLIYQRGAQHSPFALLSSSSTPNSFLFPLHKTRQPPVPDSTVYTASIDPVHRSMDQVSYLPPSKLLLTGCLVLICLFLAIYWIAPSWFGVPPITLVAPRNPGKAGEGNINQFIEEHVASLRNGFKPSWWLPK